MKRPGVDGGLLLCFVINLALSLYGAVPAIVLLVAHFALATPLWWAPAALLAWIVIVFLQTFILSAVLSWAGERGTTPPSRSEQNAYEADLRERSRNMEKTQQERLGGRR